MAVWLSSKALVSVNKVAVCQTQLNERAGCVCVASHPRLLLGIIMM